MDSWRIFYTDGSTFSSDDGAPEDAPGWHVQAIAQLDINVGVLIHHLADFYVFDAQAFGGWAGVDKFGLAQYIAEPGLKTIKLGHGMPTAAWRNLMAKIRADPQLPEKTARYSHERALD